MKDEPTENGQPSSDELQALRARVAELEASQPKATESNDGQNSADTNGWPKVFARIIAISVGVALGVLLLELIFPEPTKMDRICVEFDLDC